MPDLRYSRASLGYYQKKDRESLSALLANAALVSDYLDHQSTNNPSCLITFDNRHLPPAARIDSRLQQLNFDLEKELSSFRQSQQFTASTQLTNLQRFSNKLRTSLLPASRHPHHPLSPTISTHHHSFRSQPLPLRAKFGILLIIVVLIVTGLLVAIFTTQSTTSSESCTGYMCESQSSSSSP